MRADTGNPSRLLGSTPGHPASAAPATLAPTARLTVPPLPADARPASAATFPARPTAAPPPAARYAAGRRMLRGWPGVARPQSSAGPAHVCGSGRPALTRQGCQPRVAALATARPARTGCPARSHGRPAHTRLADRAQALSGGPDQRPARPRGPRSPRPATPARARPGPASDSRYERSVHHRFPQWMDLSYRTGPQL